MLIRVLDLETTGFTPPEHAVCEIGWADLRTESRDLAGAPTGWEVTESTGEKYVNPGRPIPPESSAIHHILDEDVANADPWDVVWPSVLFSGDMDCVAYAAHNAKFERQWITDEITSGRPWICTYKCALRLWSDAPGHSNQCLRYWRKPAGLYRWAVENAHRAGDDAYVTAFLLRDMLQEATVAQLVQWSSEPALQVRCHIGSWRGRLWSEVDTGFLHWLLARDFDEDIHFTARHHLELRRRPVAALGTRA